MIVQKFGGTSVGSPSNMQHVTSLVNDGNRKIVVLSAMSGTTNALVEISELLKDNNLDIVSGKPVSQSRYAFMLHPVLRAVL